MSTKLIPILFSTPMVQAIINGSKTMTRRIKGLEKINAAPNDWVLTPTKKKICRMYCDVNPNPIKTFFIFENIHTKEQIEIASPYGETRDEASMCDVLWVRESFTPKRHSFPIGEPFEYKATAFEDGNPTEGPWKPSIHMPFAACRIFLRITDIRVERLHDITEQDAKAEGVERTIAAREDFGARAAGMRLYRDYTRKDNSLKNYPCNGFETAKVSFETLWASINGDESWDANPWVWVVSFERCEKPTV